MQFKNCIVNSEITNLLPKNGCKNVYLYCIQKRNTGDRAYININQISSVQKEDKENMVESEEREIRICK